MTVAEFLRLLRRVLGGCIALVCGLLALGLGLNHMPILATFFAVPALFGLYLMLRTSGATGKPAPKPPASSNRPRSAARRSPATRSSAHESTVQDLTAADPVTPPSTVPRPAKRRPIRFCKYTDFAWGDPPPTEAQFRFARVNDIELCDGMSKWDVRDLFSSREEDRTAGQPATKEQLSTIREYHGVLPRKITQSEAREVIEFLEDYYLACPFCKIQIAAMDLACCACGRDLKALRIPIELP